MRGDVLTCLGAASLLSMKEIMIKHIPMYCYSLFCKQIKAPVPAEECWECRNFCASCYRCENAIGKRSARSSLISKLCNLSNQFMKCSTNQNIKALKDVATKSFECFNEYKILLPTRSDRETKFFRVIINSLHVDGWNSVL